MREFGDGKNLLSLFDNRIKKRVECDFLVGRSVNKL